MSKNIFGRFTQEFKSKPPGDKPTDGGIFRLWSWTLPLLLGLTSGWLGVACIELWLDTWNAHSRTVVTTSGQAISEQKLDVDIMAPFLLANPFKVTPRPIPENDDIAEPIDEPPPQVVGSLAAAVLKGTSPGFLAWMEDEGKLRLIRIGETFDLYTLEEVTYLNATFVKNEDRVVKEFSVGRDDKPVASQPVQILPEVRAADVQVSYIPDVSAQGAINRDAINQLLENPLDELRKVRLRPAGEDQGLRVQWLNRDSVFAQLGIQRDDVIHSINGIALQNAMDISNSLSSLMGSDQIAVEVIRNGEPVVLQHEVR